MSDLSKKSREANKARATRMAMADPHQKVDASDWTPPEMLKADVQTGPRPISRSKYRRGGKVRAEMHGEKAMKRADRAPRKAGGSAMTADSYLNRDVKAANELRPGEKHDGGMKKGGTARKSGGRVHPKGCDCAKCSGGRVGKKAGGSLDGEFQGTRPTGGRLARKSGGKAAKTNVNIIITQPKPGMGAPPMGMPPQGVPAMPPRPPMAAGPPPGMPPGMPPPGAPPPMGRKYGGKAYPIKDGAGGGMGRLEKAGLA